MARPIALRLGLLLLTVQAVLAAAVQQSSHHTPQEVLTESAKASDVAHGVKKRSVSVLARNGDLPYFRNEWNKKLHPGFRGMNEADTEEESPPSKRYLGALARGGGYAAGQGKRTVIDRVDNTIGGVVPEEELLESYAPENWSSEYASDISEEKRGGLGSLVRGGFDPYQGHYTSGKRSVSALARSGELLNIGRGSSQDRDGSDGASKRGLGSILRSGGISTIGKVPVYGTGSTTSGKRGIESLARNYALPSMISQEYGHGYDVPDREVSDDDLGEVSHPFYEEISPTVEIEEPKGMEAEEIVAKRHLGSLIRTYGLKPSVKRNIGSVLRNNGGHHYSGKRAEEISPYEMDYAVNDKRHFSSLLKNLAGHAPYHKGVEGEEEPVGLEKRYLASVLRDRNAFINGKRYLGSIIRQSSLGRRSDTMGELEGALSDDEPWSTGESSLGKRSITHGNSGPAKGEAYFDRQGNARVSNATAEGELKNAALPGSSGGMQKRSTGQGEVETKKSEDYSPKLRQRRSLMLPYSSSDEYPMPVLQNTGFYDLENTEEDEMEGMPGKRFMGRIPQMGRSRPRTGSQTQAPSRRRPRFQ